uniref:Ycf63 n=1 Tax=Eucheuma denticulatum TaxID=305493 RepID=A0A8E7PGV4_9FLOR|nr:hypothetical protein [Eucheuma denticulatum]
MIFQLNYNIFFNYAIKLYNATKCKLSKFRNVNIEYQVILETMLIVGPGSLTISLITAFFVGMVFSLQIVKEFLYLNAINLIGAILTISFIRELSPVLTSVIVIGRIGSYFTSELATMTVTQQIDALYLLNTQPFIYLIFPKILACIFMLPLLNFLCFVTSIASSIFICFTLYGIDPIILLSSSFESLLLSDLVKSLFKTIIFGFIISIISCLWGLLAKGGAKGVGKYTTASVVTSLLAIFICDFILSYFMFNKLDSAIKSL